MGTAIPSPGGCHLAGVLTHAPFAEGDLPLSVKCMEAQISIHAPPQRATAAQLAPEPVRRDSIHALHFVGQSFLK